MRVSPIDVVRNVDGVVIEDVDIATSAGFVPAAGRGKTSRRPVPIALAVVTSPLVHFLMEGARRLGG